MSRTLSYGYYLHQLYMTKLSENPNYRPEAGEDPREEFTTTNLVSIWILYVLAVWKILNSIFNFV